MKISIFTAIPSGQKTLGVELGAFDTDGALEGDGLGGLDGFLDTVGVCDGDRLGGFDGCS